MDTVGAIKLFKAVADNPFVRNLLQGSSKFCQSDNGNRLEVALELYVGVRRKACIMCHIARLVLAPILKIATKSFGATEDQLKERFHDPYWRRGLTSVIKGIALFGVTRPYVPGAPFQVVWNITRACNLRCKHCYENAGMRDRFELSTEEALRGIDILADAGVLILAFSGGEPTVRPDLPILIRHAAERGMYVAIATNAIALSSMKRLRMLKEAGLGFVQISLDGVDPETHDLFRGVKGSFEKTVQGIKNCVVEDLFVEIATTATHYNYEEIPQIVDFVERLGINWFMLYNFIPTGRGASIIEADLTPEEREDLLRMLWWKMKTMKIEVLSTAPQFARVAQEVEGEAAKCIRLKDVQFGDIMHMRGINQQVSAGMIEAGPNDFSACNEVVVPTHFYNSKFSGDLQRLADFIGGCGCGRFYLSIEPNGDIYPCVFFPHEEKVRVGNLMRDNFEEIWRRSELLKLVRNKDLLEVDCKGCEYLYTCGGCRARAYNYFKDIFAPDPGCIINKRHWLSLQRELKEGFEARKVPTGDIIVEKVVSG